MRLLDLFCGAGGCAVGYSRAGFTDIVGVDLTSQPRYPFAFVQADALEYLSEHGRKFDAIHASPPCLEFSLANKKRLTGRHANLVGQTRGLLVRSGLPWVIENVPGSPLETPGVLCGAMFGLRVIRHRHFETSFALLTPTHPRHRGGANSHRGRSGDKRDGSRFVTVTTGGNGVKLAERRAAMGIDWMNWDELAQAIPPAYTEFIGRQLLDHCRYLRG